MDLYCSPTVCANCVSELYMFIFHLSPPRFAGVMQIICAEVMRARNIAILGRSNFEDSGLDGLAVARRSSKNQFRRRVGVCMCLVRSMPQSKAPNRAWACQKKIHSKPCSGNLAVHTGATKIAGGARRGGERYIPYTHTSKNNTSMAQNTQGRNELIETNIPCFLLWKTIENRFHICLLQL